MEIKGYLREKNMPGINVKSFLLSVLAGVAATGLVYLALYLFRRLPENFVSIIIPMLVAYIAVTLIIYVLQKRSFSEALTALPVEKVYYSQEAALSDILNYLRECQNKVKVLVSRGTSLFGSKPTPTGFRETLAEKKLKEGVKILMISPESKYVEERQKETGLPGKPHTWEELGQYKGLIEQSIRLTTDLCRTQQNFEIGLYDKKIIWRLFIIDDVLFLGTYPPRHVEVDGGESACIFKISRDSNQASEQFFLAFEQLFDSWWTEFEARKEIIMQLCKICAQTEDENTAMELVEKRIRRSKLGQGGCFGCQS